NPARIGTMTRKIIVVPCIVTASLNEFFVMKCSFGVISCERMRSASRPPRAKKPSAVQMYRIPIRLWSTVVSHDVTLPRRQWARNGWTSALTAMLVRQRVRVRDQRVDLLVRPVAADRRHLADALAQDRRDPLAVVDQRVVAERGADVPRVEAVAARADVVEFFLAESDARRVRLPVCDEAVVVAPRHDGDVRRHPRVLDAAQLRAARDVRAARRLEPRMVRPPGDGVDLAAE